MTCLTVVMLLLIASTAYFSISEFILMPTILVAVFSDGTMLGFSMVFVMMVSMTFFTVTCQVYSLYFSFEITGSTTLSLTGQTFLTTTTATSRSTKLPGREAAISAGSPLNRFPIFWSDASM